MYSSCSGLFEFEGFASESEPLDLRVEGFKP